MTHDLLKDNIAMVKFKNSILYTPDGVHASIPYLVSYIGCPITSNFKELLNPKYEQILFSWSFLWQSLDWTDKIEKPIIIGGSAVKYLSSKKQLVLKQNVKYYYQDIDYPECNETRIIPDFSIVLRDNPLVDYLHVYSGRGCNWGKCTFCTMHFGKHLQLDPKYVASVILHANKLGKLAGLTAPSHTVDWLLEVEKHLPPGKRYWCYLNPHDSGYSKLKNAQEIFIGSEYFSNSVLKRVRKGVTSEQIIDAIIEILSAGINVYSSIIEDLYETPEELHEHTTNKINLLSHVFPPKASWGKLRLVSCKLISKNNFDNFTTSKKNEKQVHKC